MDIYKAFEIEINRQKAEKALVELLKKDKKDIQKTEIVKATRKEGHIVIAFSAKDEVICFILDEEKKLSEVQLTFTNGLIFINMESLCKEKRDKFEEILNDYILFFKLRLRLLTNS